MAFGLMNAQAQNMRALQEADAYYESEAYYSAAKLYEQYLNPVKKRSAGEGLRMYKHLGSGPRSTAKKVQSKADVHYKTAQAYRMSFYFDDAIKNYEAALQQDEKKYAEALYWMAVCQRNMGRLEASQALLDRYMAHPGATEEIKRLSRDEQSTIAYIRQQMQRKDTSLFVIQKADTSSGRGYFALGGQANTSYVITGTIPTGTTSKTPVPYVNRLYAATASDKRVVAGLPLSVEGLDAGMNQMAGSLGSNGNILYFTQWGNTTGKPVAKIYYAQKQASGSWSTPILLPGISQETSNQKHPHVSTDGKTLYFASDRAGGSGKYDIWYAALDESGMPSAPQNAGSIINTSGDDVAPFYHSQSKTLVFSSNGRQGMGGFDFYYATEKDGAWYSTENAGYPLNSNRDELFFYSGGKKLMQHVFFSSDRNSDCCMQLFHLEKLPKKRIINGKLADCKTTEPLSDVLLTTGSGKQVKTDASGGYSFEVEESVEKEITLTFQKDKYTEKTFIASLATNDSDPLVTRLDAEPLCLEKIVIPEPVIVKKEEVAYVNFDFNKSNLLKSNAAVLDSFLLVLKNNPTFTVKIDAHTDTKGTEKYNLKLSNQRANAVATYFISQGIESSRVIFEGFGKCCPLEPEVVNGKYDNEAARRNRRALIHISRK
jgi:outer membrane protein OmpA-like peptidoglycan-associated protein/tetratricopeptide (TPR) repeat protein